jgi:hypothetical protein
VTSRVLPPPRSRSTHDQVLSGLDHSSLWFGAKLSTFQAVLSDGVRDPAAAGDLDAATGQGPIPGGRAGLRLRSQRSERNVRAQHPFLDIALGLAERGIASVRRGRMPQQQVRPGKQVRTMSKTAIIRWRIWGLIAIVPGGIWIPSSSLALATHHQGVHDAYGRAMAGLIVAGGLFVLAGVIAWLVGWVAAVLNTRQLPLVRRCRHQGSYGLARTSRSAVILT